MTAPLARDAIQPHGAVLVLDAESLQIQAASASAICVLGWAPEALIGRSARELFSPRSVRCIHAAIARSTAFPRAYSISTLRESGRAFYVWVHVRQGQAIIDLERYQSKSARSLQTMFSGIDDIAELAHSGERLEAILQTAVGIFQRTFGFDRVLLQRFNETGGATVVAEARGPDTESLQGMQLPSASTSRAAKERLRLARVQHIPDVNYAPSPLVGAPKEGAVNLSRSCLRIASARQVRMLRSMGVVATLGGALIHHGELWGQIECQHLSGPKHVHGAMRLAFLRMCADLSRQIGDHQSRRAQQAASEREAALETLVFCLESGNRESLTADGNAGLLLHALRADGFALLTRQRYIPLGLAPAESEVRRALLQVQADGTRATTSYQWPTSGNEGTDYIASMLLADLGDTQASKLLWFRRQCASSASSMAAAPWSSEELSFAESLRYMIESRRERRLQTDLQNLQRITANSNVAISIAEAEPTTGLGRRIVMVSEAFERGTGYRASEVVGHSPGFLLGPDSGPETLTAIRQKLARGQGFEGDILTYRKDGSTFWADTKISPIVDAYGSVTHWMTVYTDVSERRNVRFGLEQQNRALEASLSEAAALAQGKSVLLGQVGRELQGPLAIMLGQIELAQQIAESPRVRESLGVVRGSVGQLLDVVNTILDAAQFGMGAAESKVGAPNAEREHLRKASFFAAASHDLLQPLNAARIYASALSEQLGIGDSSHELARRIDQALIAAEEIIDVLVEVTKLDSGAMPVEVETFPLNPQLEFLAAQMSSLASSRQLQLRLRPSRWLVRSDRRLLRRVLQNLMANALRYTATGGVLVGTRKRGDQLLIEVWDTGIGIDQTHLSKIFEEFSRINQRSPWGDRGSGLGLAICERICRLLGHRLEVDSVPGRGSRFTIVVPLMGVGESAAAPLAVTEASAAQRIDGLSIPLNVLCVDDDPDILRSMRVLLDGWGVRVETAEDSATALGLIGQFVPDVLLVDQQLGPYELGMALIKKMRVGLGSVLIGSVLITADHSDELRERCQKHDIHLLYKPTKAVRLRGLMTHFAELAAARGDVRRVVKSSNRV